LNVNFMQLVSAIVVILLLHWLFSEKPQTVTKLRNKRNLEIHYPMPEIKDKEGDTIVTKIDLCNLIQCYGDPNHYIWADKYICTQDEECGMYEDSIIYCPTWHTGPLDWGYNPTSPQKNHLTIVKGIPQHCTFNSCNPLLITLKDARPSDSGIYPLGVYLRGSGLIGTFCLKITEVDTKSPPSGSLHNTNALHVMALETGYADKNEWFEWMTFTAQESNVSNCIMCSTARPQLGTAPLQLNELADSTGLQCILQLLDKAFSPTTEQCKSLSLLCPPVNKRDVPPSVDIYPGNNTCFVRSGPCKNVHNLPPAWCEETFNITTDSGDYSATWFVNQTISRAYRWWICRDGKLRPRLPSQWRGRCALVQLLMPFHIFSLREYKELGERLLFASRLHCRTRRAVSPRGSFDSRVYIDAIGMPRGVPDEFKARNQIDAGFESFLSWWVTVNKNVDCINYLYYNQQHFVNYTRDAKRGIADQLGPTSLMLAERGGVCKLFGTFCCTFIPNNTSPDGSITKALEGLTALSEELAENSGIDNPFTSFLESCFRKWSGFWVDFSARGCSPAGSVWLLHSLSVGTDAETDRRLSQSLSLSSKIMLPILSQ
uniref:Uncharacterized protein n=1 Tax=Monopterus albus TaxID=43700 RepID=A0A3Q3IYP0_MONAL